MSDERPAFNQVNLVVRDFDASRAFYERLGVAVGDAPDWPPGSGARHANTEQPGGVHFDLDNITMAGIWNAGVRDDPGSGRPVLGFSVTSREAVDRLYAELVEAGAVGRQEPYDAFFGARYAVVQDPDGNDIGLMSPPDEARRFVPEVP